MHRTRPRPRDHRALLGRLVSLRVEAACPGLLVLPDTYFPGWKATVNGRDRTIYPTDGAFRGVSVPEGTSRVEFRYEPRAFCTGLVLAVAGIAGFVLIVLVSAWRSRGIGRPSTGTGLCRTTSRCQPA